MSNFTELVRKRRSIRKFEDRPVEADKLEAVVRAGLMAPSSKNSTPWQFVIVDDREVLEAFSVCREMGCKFLEGAPAAIVVLADESKSDVWVEDASIAAVVMQLQAEDLGLGSCWMQVRNRRKDESQTTEDFIKSLINAPESMRVECVVAVGYKLEEKKPFDDARLQLDKVHKNRF